MIERKRRKNYTITSELEQNGCFLVGKELLLFFHPRLEDILKLKYYNPAMRTLKAKMMNIILTMTVTNASLALVGTKFVKVAAVGMS